MKRKILIITIICAMVLGNVLPLLDDTPSTVQITQDGKTYQTAQDFNISSYLDFSEVTLELILDKLYNESDGSLFRSADHKWELIDLLSGLADYYWGIAALAHMYEASVQQGAPNETLKTIVGRAAQRMAYLYIDDEYPGFGINSWSAYILRTSKRAGIQSYAYQALRIAESVDPSLNFTLEKQTAIDCLVDMLYDEENGGFHFFTLRNGSLDIPDNVDEIYPNDGKRLDHLALGAIALYDAGIEQNNSTLIQMANASMSFLVSFFQESFQGDYLGLKLAVNRTGGNAPVAAGRRPANVVVSDVNAIAIRALLKAYDVTGNTSYLSLSESTFQALMQFSWDTVSGGWYAETLDGIPFDPLDDEDVKFYKYSEIQFQVVRTLVELYDVTDNLYYIRMIIDVLDLTLQHLWDTEDGGFYQNGNSEWSSFSEEWQWHHMAIQGQSIIALETIWSYGFPLIGNVRINPVSPRPVDSVLVSSTVLDDDGIDTVYVNYTSDVDGTVTTGIFELLPHPEAGGLFNSTFGFLNDSARVNFRVVANDTLGNDFIAGSYYFIVRADIFEPLVELKSIYPEEIRALDPVVLEFSTYEFPIHSATLYCRLHWKLNDGPYQEENTTLVSIEEDHLIWRIEIGPFQGGDVISYYCMAVDETGNWGISGFYRLTILTPVQYVSPLAAWQILATIGLIAAPGAGVAYVWSRKRYAQEQQRTLKKEARKRGSKGRGRGRSRSRSRTSGGN